MNEPPQLTPLDAIKVVVAGLELEFTLARQLWNRLDLSAKTAATQHLKDRLEPVLSMFLTTPDVRRTAEWRAALDWLSRSIALSWIDGIEMGTATE